MELVQGSEVLDAQALGVEPCLAQRVADAVR